MSCVFLSILDKGMRDLGDQLAISTSIFPYLSGLFDLWYRKHPPVAA